MGHMDHPDAVRTLERDLRGIFGTRLQSLVVYGARADTSATTQSGHAAHHHHESQPTHTLAIVDGLSTDDLRACAARVDAWHEAALATPLMVAAKEFSQSLDAFPFEFGAILADHHVVAGPNPFEGLAVDQADLRRACEVQARGHLLHLREGYLETLGRGDRLAVLIVDSAGAFAALLTNVARLDGVTASNVATAARHVGRRLELAATTPADVVSLVGVKEISSAEAERLFPPYLDLVERLVAYLDAWQ